MTDITIADITRLRLSPISIPLYSARAVTETLAPIQIAARYGRTVNGELIDLSAIQLRKYGVSLTCTDQQSPALSGVWPGQILTVDCISELAYETNSDNGPERTVVEGSSREESGFTFYRPRLTMMVTAFSYNTDEYEALIGWTLTLEEV